MPDRMDRVREYIEAGHSYDEAVRLAAAGLPSPDATAEIEDLKRMLKLSTRLQKEMARSLNELEDRVARLEQRDA